MARTKTYSDKLRDPRWQKKRLEVLARAEWTCEVCYDEDSTLHVHHKAYFKGREPWEYDNDQLAVLCERCHKEISDAPPDLLAEVCSRLPMDGPYCRRDIGIVMAALFKPSLVAKNDDFANRMLAELSSGPSDDLLLAWDSIYWKVVHKLAEEKK